MIPSADDTMRLEHLPSLFGLPVNLSIRHAYRLLREGAEAFSFGAGWFIHWKILVLGVFVIVAIDIPLVRGSPVVHIAKTGEMIFSKNIDVFNPSVEIDRYLFIFSRTFHAFFKSYSVCGWSDGMGKRNILFRNKSKHTRAANWNRIQIGFRQSDVIPSKPAPTKDTIYGIRRRLAGINYFKRENTLKIQGIFWVCLVDKADISPKSFLGRFSRMIQSLNHPEPLEKINQGLKPGNKNQNSGQLFGWGIWDRLWVALGVGIFGLLIAVYGVLARQAIGRSWRMGLVICGWIIVSCGFLSLALR